MTQSIGEIITKTITIPQLNIKLWVNPVTIITSWVIMTIVLIVAFIIAMNLKRFPGKLQTSWEVLYGGFSDMAHDALGEDAKKFIPLVLTIFLFVLLSNWASIIPSVHSPTEDLNTCLGLGILVFIIAHYSAIMKKGFKRYLGDYFKPFFIFFPINIIGEFGKILSHSFRLFGNLFGGAIILVLIGPVTLEIFRALQIPKFISPAFLFIFYFIHQVFFGLFVGLVQALVFSLLALTYIAILREG